MDMGHDLRFVNSNVGGRPGKGRIAERQYSADYVQPDDYGRILTKGIDGFRPEQAVVLKDFAAARDMVRYDPDAWRSLPTWHHVPVEGRGLPPLWNKLWQILRPVAITRFGADEVGKVTGTDVPFVYHGVDHDRYFPVSRERPIIGVDSGRGDPVPLMVRDKRGAKEHFGIPPDATLLLSCERHMPRKNLNALMRACAPVLEERDDVFLVLHCRRFDFGGNLDDTKSRLSPKAQSRVGFTGAHDTWTGMAEPVLAALHNAADLYVHCASEGFGLNLANSVACGVPVLGLAYSAVPEVVGPGGQLLEQYGERDNEYDHHWAVPDEPAYTAALRGLLEDRDAMAGMAARAVEHSAQFTWDRAASEFDALIRGA